MIMGLVPAGELPLSKNLQFGLHGLAGLEALFGIGQTQSQLPPIGVCKDANGNVVDCGAGGSGTGTGPCDPSLVEQGYSCYVGGDGSVTYVPAGGNPPPVTGTPGGTNPPITATPTGGTSTTGAGTGSGGGVQNTPCPAGQNCGVKPSGLVWVLLALTAVMALGVVRKAK